MDNEDRTPVDSPNVVSMLPPVANPGLPDIAIEWPIGTVCKLKCDSPDMCIMDHREDGMMLCVWFSEMKEVQFADFPAGALYKVEE